MAETRTQRRSGILYVIMLCHSSQAGVPLQDRLYKREDMACVSRISYPSKRQKTRTVRLLRLSISHRGPGLGQGHPNITQESRTFVITATNLQLS
ncbi:hypothetical protein EI94DRAFT_1740886 [Lactarius quietus]|nr:hypothetical protein EI94DRAFT_1740886 [Lactarius quietus]